MTIKCDAQLFAVEAFLSVGCQLIKTLISVGALYLIFYSISQVSQDVVIKTRPTIGFLELIN